MSENETGAPESVEPDAPAPADPLVEEGDIAADYIEELLDIADLDGDIEIDVRSGRAYVAVTSAEGDSIAALSAPETVSALQELTRLAVQNATGNHSGVILDIGGSRDARVRELTVLVEDAIAELEAGSASVRLAPMSSYERKIVHDIVAERGFRSESDGEGRMRRVVIAPA